MWDVSTIKNRKDFYCGWDSSKGSDKEALEKIRTAIIKENATDVLHLFDIEFSRGGREVLFQICDHVDALSLGSTNVDHDFFSALFSCAPKRMTSFSSYHNQFREKGVKVLINYLKNLEIKKEKKEKRWSPTSLSFCFEWLGSELGAMHLGRMLKTNSTLLEFVLDIVDVQDGGAKYFAEALCHNTTLQYLQLSNGLIGPKGLGYLSQGLTRNRTLTALNVRENNFTPESLISFLDVLSESSFYLKHHRIIDNDYDIKKKEKKEKKNRTLLELDVGLNNIDRRVGKAIEKVILTNKNLRLIRLWIPPKAEKEKILKRIEKATRYNPNVIVVDDASQRENYDPPEWYDDMNSLFSLFYVPPSSSFSSSSSSIDFYFNKYDPDELIHQLFARTFSFLI